MPAIPPVQHVAEKLHAYTRRYGPDGEPSSRPKDLIDLVLLEMHEDFAARELRLALERTFATRGTHPLPDALPPPLQDWARPYRELADQVGIASDLADGYAEARRFLEPILARSVSDEFRWNNDTRSWDPH